MEARPPSGVTVPIAVDAYAACCRRASQSPNTSVSELSSTMSRSACNAMPRLAVAGKPALTALVSSVILPEAAHCASAALRASSAGLASSTTMISAAVPAPLANTLCRQRRVSVAAP
jgi:hypothetical protein